jgi:N-acetylmuramoyl-L-alanine amidase
MPRAISPQPRLRPWRSTALREPKELKNSARLPAGFSKLSRRFAMKSFGSFLALVVAALLFAAAAAEAKTVVLDAGHGGHDRGGVPGDPYAEKIYTLDVARRIRARLIDAGYRVVMTRSDDTFIGLDQRCAISNSQSGAIFVSVHFNSAPRAGASGIETYYYSGKSAGLAGAIHPRLVRAAGTEDRRIRVRGYYVLRHNRLPAVLCECGFLTNPDEGRRIASSPEHRQRLADAIAGGIMARY